MNSDGIIPLANLGLDPALMAQLHKEAKRTPLPPADTRRLSYYNETDAKLLLEVIQHWRDGKFAPMTLNPASMVPPLQMNSLKTKIWNSKKYIIEVMMPGTETADICARIKLEANGGVWVMKLGDKAEVQTASGMLAGCSFDSPADNNIIRNRFLEWISQPHEEREKLVLPEDPEQELALSDEDLDFFRQREAEILQRYRMKITRTKIIVVRLTLETPQAS